MKLKKNLHILIFIFFALLMINLTALAQNVPEMPQQGIIEKGLVILAEFPHVRHQVSRNFVVEKFSQGLDSYIQEMSYYQVSLEIDVTQKWHRMPHQVSQYKGSFQNLEVNKSRVRKLIPIMKFNMD